VSWTEFRPCTARTQFGVVTAWANLLCVDRSELCADCRPRGIHYFILLSLVMSSSSSYFLVFAYFFPFFLRSFLPTFLPALFQSFLNSFLHFLPSFPCFIPPFFYSSLLFLPSSYFFFRPPFLIWFLSSFFFLPHHSMPIQHLLSTHTTSHRPTVKKRTHNQLYVTQLEIYHFKHYRSINFNNNLM
jgi:hypothetical protein